MEIAKHATFLLANQKLSFQDIREGMYVYAAAGKETFEKFIGSIPNDAVYVLRVLRSINKIMNENLLRY